MQLVGHAPFGARLNRALGLALRKRFCVTFDFELQAAASDDAILLSLGPQHSFPLDRVPKFLASGTVEEVVRQAVLTSPMFPARWRWNLNTSLAVLRWRGGRKNPPAIQRMESDDLMAAVFPTLAACQENVAPGPLEIPDHLLVRQTLEDCLRDAMDIDGLRELVAGIEAGRVRVVVRDTTEPSVLAHEILNGRPFTYLDDAPLEERRSRAVPLRRGLPVEPHELGRLDQAAIDRVAEQVRPEPRDEHELHDLLLNLVAVRPDEAWRPSFDALVAARRAVQVDAPGGALWSSVERLPAIGALYPHAKRVPDHPCPVPAEPPDEETAAAALLRGHLECRGPSTAAALAAAAGLPETLMVARTRRAGGRGVRDPRAVQRDGWRRGVLFPPSAGADPRLHQAAPPARSRAGDRAGLHAVPAALAARRGRDQAGGAVRGAGRHRAAAGFRAGHRGVGELDPGRAGGRLPAGLAGRAVHVRAGVLGPAVDPGHRAGRRAAPGRDGAISGDADHAGACGMTCPGCCVLRAAT